MYREPKPGTVSHCPDCKRGMAHYTYPGSPCLRCRYENPGRYPGLPPVVTYPGGLTEAAL